MHDFEPDRYAARAETSKAFLDKHQDHESGKKHGCAWRRIPIALVRFYQQLFRHQIQQCHQTKGEEAGQPELAELRNRRTWQGSSW
ncbi:hypothetical protein ACUXI4_000111 [Pantoea piersonii]